MGAVLGSRGGFTFVEVLAASLITAVVAAGTLMAFVAAARMVRREDNPSLLEASGYAQEVLEDMRNRVATDDAFFASAPGVWTPAAAQWPLPPAAGAGSNSILALGTAKRCYRVLPENCDGVGPNDCYRVDVQVCWGDLSGCQC